jgi:hypothetical protein
MCGAILENESRGADVQRAVGGNVLTQKPGSMLKPSFRWTGGTHVRMFFGEPHLIEQRMGPAGIADDPGQSDSIVCGMLHYPDMFGRWCFFPPIRRILKIVFQFDGMSMEKILRVINP